MNDTDRETLEKQILLRSTGELPQVDHATLNAALEADPEAAAFARFVAGTLPARAPRDFAAVAIDQAMPERSAIPFPRAWKIAAAAAAVAMASLVATRFSTQETARERFVTTPATTRVTADISARMDALDSELSTARQRLSQGRYHRPKEIL
jgi:hypothetical protein